MRTILTAIPFIWIILALPFANTTHPMILGLPFVAFWIQLGVVVSVVCIHTLYIHDKKLRKKKAAETAQAASDAAPKEN
jgi:uncharacterized membrane protein